MITPEKVLLTIYNGTPTVLQWNSNPSILLILWRLLLKVFVIYSNISNKIHIPVGAVAVQQVCSISIILTKLYLAYCTLNNYYKVLYWSYLELRYCIIHNYNSKYLKEMFHPDLHSIGFSETSIVFRCVSKSSSRFVTHSVTESVSHDQPPNRSFTYSNLTKAFSGTHYNLLHPPLSIHWTIFCPQQCLCPSCTPLQQSLTPNYTTASVLSCPLN